MILNIHEAKREGAKLVIGIAGPSGSGKTHSAILLADGMVKGDSKKIGFLDTENKRGSLYADVLKDKEGNVRRFLIGDLIPPFTPDRYKGSIKEFEDAGVEVLIIDTVSHEWEGTGGCIEIADGASKAIVGWNKAKTAHKKFMNTLLQCDMHIICCIRAREKTSFKNPNKPVSLGVQPIQEGNFMFDMTASILMQDEGKYQIPLKCPSDLRSILGRGNGYITSKDGASLIDWVDDGSKLNRNSEKYKNRLLGVTDQGLIHTKKCWDKVPADIKETFEPGFQTQLFGSAESYDTLKKSNEVPQPDKSLKDAISKIPKREKADPLHSTPEWEKWEELIEKFPEITVKFPVPITVDQCIGAVKAVKQQVDQDNA